MKPNATFEPLLAKTPRDAANPLEGETLFGHARQVAHAFRALFGTKGAPTRLSERWLRFFQLDADADCEPFIANGTAAAVLHDIGKANDSFQRIVRGIGTGQAVLHEHLSGLVLGLPCVRQRIESIAGLSWEVLFASSAGHHLRAKPPDFAQLLAPDIPNVGICRKGVESLLQTALGETETGLGGADGLPERLDLHSSGGFSLSVFREKLRREIHKRFRKFHERSPRRFRLLMAVRAALVQADSVGSALFRTGQDVDAWVARVFNENQNLDGTAIAEKVIFPRVRQIEETSRPFRWNGFQNEAETLPCRALMLAPCGSGKTLAAWRWIKGRAQEHPVARVIFLYPTRGTATEGFRDYVSWAPEADAALLHGTAAFDIQGMFKNPDDGRFGKDFSVPERLFALGYWPRRVFSATVDQFFGFMQHSYRSTCLLPLLVDSAVVVDEVHSFGLGLFSALKKFLKAFDLPVLCMTASLPPERRRQLEEECGLQPFPSDPRQFEDLARSSEMPRYLVRRLPDEGSAFDAVRPARGEKRILWVVNTVSRCQQLAKRLQAQCYHSRFKLEDRRKRHDQVVRLFQQEGSPAFVVATQVCEMSLDLDADILVTEEAPVPSLIQRMGRCNRHARPSDGRMGEVVVLPAPSEKPYDPEELAGVQGFLESLDGREASQSDLQDLLEEFGPQAVEVERYAAFLEDGIWAKSREHPLREGQDYTVSAILDSDMDRYKALRRGGRPADGLVVPVPKRFAKPDSRLRGGLMLADGSRYDASLGYCDTAEERP